MDLSSVFAVLQQADKQAQETNPYLGFQNIGDQLGQLVVKQSGQLDGDGNQRNGFGDILGAGLLTGLLSGGAGVAARGYQADQNKLALDSLSQILRGGDIQQPEGMAPNVFNAIRGPASLIRAQQNLENQQLMLKGNQDLRNKVLGTVVEEAVKNPYRPGSQEVLAGLGLGANPTPQPVAGNKEPSAAPASGQMTVEDYMKKYQGNKELADAAAKRDMEAPDRKEDDLVNLRTKFESDPEVRLFQSVDIGFRAMQKAYEDTTGTSDVELTRRAIQAIEPGLAVRTDDQTAIANSSSIPEAWKAYMQGAISNKTKLPDGVREGLMRIAERSYNEHAQVFNNKLAFNLGEFKRREFPGQFTYMAEATPSQRFSQAANPGTQPAPAAAQNKQATGGLSVQQIIDLAPGVKQIDGQVYELKDGAWRKKGG